ncbi:MAG: excalibur calcium-binding domain-containing protein [Actinomycetota bacterium]|nr:excalibur calcium-binding domain-containing protein [Actinomycetota bacterium]
MGGFLSGRVGRRLSIKKILTLAAVLAVLLVSSACSSADEGKGGEEDVIAGASKQRSPDPAPKRTGTDGEIGDSVEAGVLSFRIFEVRAKDRIYAISGPGKKPVTRGNISSEYVAIDYLVQNISGSPLTTGAKATLLDEQGNSYNQDSSIEPPSGGTDGMELGTAQTRASTMFFRVPNGIIPAALEIKTAGGGAGVDLLERDLENVPPDDYLRVYHLYFNEQAYEEAYEMFDPASVQNITLGEWLAFYEPLWGKRYVSLDGLIPLSEGSDRATFQMTRTFYDADGDIVADPEVNPSVTQEIVEVDGKWMLVMRDDLVSDIIAVIGPDETPEPETKAPEPEKEDPERTEPPSTVLETTQQAEATRSAAPARDYDCEDFETQEEAQFYLAPGDPYRLDEDGNGVACETLP